MVGFRHNIVCFLTENYRLLPAFLFSNIAAWMAFMFPKGEIEGRRESTEKNFEKYNFSITPINYRGHCGKKNRIRNPLKAPVYWILWLTALSPSSYKWDEWFKLVSYCQKLWFSSQLWMLWQKSIRHHLHGELPDRTACLEGTVQYLLASMMEAGSWISRKINLTTTIKSFVSSRNEEEKLSFFVWGKGRMKTSRRQTERRRRSIELSYRVVGTVKDIQTTDIYRLTLSRSTHWSVWKSQGHSSDKSRVFWLTQTQMALFRQC